MAVRAKFWCHWKEEKDGLGSVTLFPVTSGSEENERYFHMTPSGNLQLATINKDALDQFEQGKQYYIDITPAD